MYAAHPAVQPVGEITHRSVMLKSSADPGAVVVMDSI